MKRNARMLAVGLLLLLLPQIVGWIALSRATPFMGFNNLSWYKQQPVALQISDFGYADGSSWHEVLRYDLQARRWEPVADKVRARAYELVHPTTKSQYWRMDWGSFEENQPCTAELIDNATQQVLKTRQLPRPCSLVDQRFAVYVDKGWNWLDLDDEASEFQKFTALGPMINATWPHSSSPEVTVDFDTPITNGGPKIARAGIVHFRPGTGPQVVTTWRALNCGLYLYMVDTGQEVISVDPSGKQFEFRSKQDGAVIYTEPIPEGVDFARMRWDDCLSMDTPDGPLNYDVLNRIWIKGPKNGVLEAWQKGTANYQFRSDDKLVVYNVEAQKVLCEVPISDLIHFLDDQTIVHVDQQSWIQFHFRSADDGRILKTYAPFSYVNPCLVVFLVLYALWAVLWMRTSPRAGLWAWIDNLIVIGLLMALLVYRGISVGPAWDIFRPTYQYLGGCVLAVLSLSLMWLAFGSTRWMLRLIPLMICEAVVLAICRIAFGEKLDPVWRAMLTVNVPAIGILAVLMCLRLLKWRLVNDVQLPASSDSLRGRTQLADLFLVTVGVALVTAAGGSSFSLFQQAGVGIGWADMVASVIGVSLIISMMLAGLSCSKSWFVQAAFVSCILLILLCAETLDRFPVIERIEYSWQHAGSARVVMSGAAACFVAAVPYRLRGYRLIRS